MPVHGAISAFPTATPTACRFSREIHRPRGAGGRPAARRAVGVDRLKLHPAVGGDPRLVRPVRRVHRVDVIEDLPPPGTAALRGAPVRYPGPARNAAATASRTSESGPSSSLDLPLASFRPIAFHYRHGRARQNKKKAPVPEHRGSASSPCACRRSLEPQLLFYDATSGRIMSCSSCSRMWQCQTYSSPPVRPRAEGTGQLVRLTVTAWRYVPSSGHGNGSSTRAATVVTSPGYIVTVSLRPISFGSGATGIA